MLKVSNQLNHAKDTVIKDKRTLYQQISKSLKMIHIGKVILNDVKLRYENHKGPKVAVSELQDLNLSAFDLLIDSASQFDKNRFLYCREMDAELNNYSGQSANGQYKYKAKQVTFSTRTSQLNAYDCSLIATRPPEEFFEHTYKDRFVSHLDSLQLENFDFEVYNKYHTISGSNLILTNGSINIFGNPRKDPKADTVDRVRTFPNVAIFRLPNLKIDTISLRSIDASYEEYNRKTKRAGIVRFDRTRGYLYNVTNDSAALTKNHTCKININTQFMNRGNLNVDFVFNLTDKLHSYSYKGRLQAARAVTEERARIARELHDLVAHSIGVIVIQAQGAQRALDTSPDQAREALSSIETAGRSGMAEMRRLLGLLTDGGAGAGTLPQPTLNEIPDLVARLRATGVPVDLRVEGIVRALPAGIELTGYRMVQEATTNVLKHAGRVPVDVRLQYEPDWLDIEVIDQGPTDSMQPVNGHDSGSHGLVAMRERVSFYGGTLDTGPTTGGGFSVHARIPLERKPA